MIVMLRIPHGPTETAMTSSISASMKSHSMALAQSVTLHDSGQGKSEDGYPYHLGLLIWVSRTPISAAKGASDDCSDDRIDVRAEEKKQCPESEQSGFRP